MYQVSIETHFSAAHRLRNYKGLCENLHGHNWKVEATVCSEKLDNSGMVIDFNILKQKTKAIVDVLDHQYLNEIDPFKETNPSSENVAAYIFSRLSIALKDDPVTLISVSVWESDKSKATFSPSSR
jgi:6-pyruvoyltetrahydropterin/6-carboxytetrahydropterin synthase